MAILDNYDDIEGFGIRGEHWEWISDCGHYKIVQCEEEGNYCGFDVYYHSESLKDNERPHRYEGKHLPYRDTMIHFVLEDAKATVARHRNIMKENSHA